MKKIILILITILIASNVYAELFINFFKEEESTWSIII